MDAIPPDWLERVRTLGCRSLHVAQQHLTAEWVETIHGEGIAVLAYTVNEPGRAITLFEWGVDAIVTDELREIRPDFLAVYGLGR